MVLVVSEWVLVLVNNCYCEGVVSYLEVVSL